MDDLEWSLRVLVLRILLRWRLIIVCMLIGALAVDGFAFVKDQREAARIRQLIAEYERGREERFVEEKDRTEESVVALKEFEEELSERQIAEVQSVVSMYKMFQRPYTDTVEYINHSIKMQIDPNAVPTLVAQYKIDTHYSVSYPEISKRDYSGDILNSIYYMLMNDATIRKMADILGENVDSVYARELIVTWTAGNDTYCISVFGRDQKECRALIAVLEEEMTRVLDELQPVYGPFYYQLFSEEYFEAFNPDLLNAQQMHADKLNGLRNTTNGLVNDLTDSQKTYFYALLNNDDTVTLELPVEREMEEITDPNELPMPVPRAINLKMMLAGAILGMLLPSLYLLCRILFGGKLIASDRMAAAYGLAALGTWRISEEPGRFLSGIDRWLIHLLDGRGSQFSPDEHLKMIAARIRLAAAENEWKQVYLTGTVNDPESRQAIAGLCEALKDQVENVSCGQSAVYDPESLEAMTRADATVIVEREDVSRYDEIRSELALCRQYQVPLMGVVILK